MNTQSALKAVFRAYSEAHPAESARALEGLPPADAAALLTQLPAHLAGPVLERVTPEAAAALLSSQGPDATRKLLATMESRHAATILRHLEDVARDAALSGIDPARARRIRALLQYPAETAGGMMETRITSLPVDVTVGQAIALLRRAPRTTLFYLYVTERDGKLAGVLSMRDLLLAAPRDAIRPLVNDKVLSVAATLPQDDLAVLVRENRFVALPVVDSEGFLLGVVRSEEIIGAIEREAFGDFQRMVGAGEDERALSPVPFVVRKRLPWLYVNLASAFLASAVVGVFEHTIAAVTALAVLLPIVAGQGGNTGAQSLAVVMRGMALRELLPGSAWRLLRKEGLAALANGTAIAAGTGLAVLLWDGRWALVGIISASMVVNMTAAGISGAAIPLLLRASGRDPAQASSIFLTTVTDVVGFASFLGFATLLLPLLE